MNATRQQTVNLPTQESSSTPPRDTHAWKDRYWTIPNLICGVRIVGSLALVPLAIAGHVTAFVVTFVILSLSDWVDGKLARWLKQRSDFGARLDSASDGILYTGLLIGCLVLKWNVLRQEVVWLAFPLVTFAASLGYGLWKYGRAPSYHTYGAKCSHWLVFCGAVSLLLDWSIWPLRVAMTAGTLTNLEAVAITSVLPQWHADVLSLRHALRIHKTADPTMGSAQTGIPIASRSSARTDPSAT